MQTVYSMMTANQPTTIIIINYTAYTVGILCESQPIILTTTTLFYMLDIVQRYNKNQTLMMIQTIFFIKGKNNESNILPPGVMLTTTMRSKQAIVITYLS